MPAPPDRTSHRPSEKAREQIPPTRRSVTRESPRTDLGISPAPCRLRRPGAADCVRLHVRLAGRGARLPYLLRNLCRILGEPGVLAAAASGYGSAVTLGLGGARHAARRRRML